MFDNLATNDLIKTGKKLYSQGDFSGALNVFQKLLTTIPNNAWYHFHVGQCLNRLNSHHLAALHLKIAIAEIDDYKVAAELARSYNSLGLNKDLFELFERYILHPSFWRVAIDDLFSASSLRQILDFWIAHRDELIKNVGTKNQWIRFYDSKFQVFSEFIDTFSIDEANLSFSARFPNCLEIMSSADLRNLLLYSLDSHIHICFGSWDINKKLLNPEQSGSIYNNLPFWLREKILFSPVRMVFDISEEAPNLRMFDLERACLSLIGTLNPRLDIALLTANSKIDHTGTFSKMIEYNIYPIIIANAYSDQPPALQPVVGHLNSFNFTLMNGMSRPHRIALMILLHRNNMLEHVNYSWWNGSNQKNRRGMALYIDQCRQLMPELEITAEEIKWIDDLPERVFDTPDDVWSKVNTHFMCSSVNKEYMQSAPIHIVSETEFAVNGTLRMTEKSIKPIICGVPFLIVGVSQSLQAMREIGFDILDDVIDHSYDLERNHAKRLQKVVDELIRLKDVRFDASRLKAFADHNSNTLRKWASATREQYVHNLMSWLSESAVRGRSSAKDLEPHTVRHANIERTMVISDEKDVIQKCHMSGFYYEQEELDIISEHFPKNGVFVDIGTNVGNHLVFTATYLEALRLIPIECSPNAIRLLRHNVAMNGLLDRVDLGKLGYAVGSSEYFADMHFTQSHNLGSGRVRKSTSGKIQVVLGDHLLAGEKQIDFIKIDVEGLEIEVLLGLRNTITKFRPLMFVEVDKRNIDMFEEHLVSIEYEKVTSYQRYRSLDQFLIKPIER